MTLNCSDMVETELEAKFREFVGAVAEEFQRELHLVEPQPTKKILEYNRGNITWQDHVRPKYGKFFHQHHQRIRDLDEYEECIDFGIENYEPISTYHSNRRGFGELLITFATLVFSENNRSMAFSDSDFDQVYPDFEEDLLAEELPVRTFIPLHGLDMDEDVIELDSQSRIRKVEKSDIELLVDFESPTGGTISEDWDSSATHFLFEYEQMVEKDLNSIGGGSLDFDQLDEAKHRIRSVTTALRLAYSGEVGYSNHYDHKPAAWSGGITTRRRTVRPLFFVGSMEIEDTTEFQRLYDLLKSTDFESLEPNMEMSVEKFNSSYIRESDKVAFADLMIVAEALCSGNQNLSKNMLAQRVAILLEDEFEERQNVFEEFGELYDERSRVWGVAHGGGRTELGDTSLETARQYVKDLLLLFLEDFDGYGGHGEILSELEDKIEKNHLKVDFPE